LAAARPEPTQPPPLERLSRQERALDAGDGRSGRVARLPPPISSRRESVMRRRRAPSGVIHSVSPWSSGREARSGRDDSVLGLKYASARRRLPGRRELHRHVLDAVDEVRAEALDVAGELDVGKAV